MHQKDDICLYAIVICDKLKTLFQSGPNCLPLLKPLLMSLLRQSICIFASLFNVSNRYHAIFQTLDPCVTTTNG